MERLGKIKKVTSLFACGDQIGIWPGTPQLRSGIFVIHGSLELHVVLEGYEEETCRNPHAKAA